MAIWFVVAIPVLIMFFALAMERLEHRLRSLAARESLVVQDKEVEEYLSGARTTEGGALAGSNGGGALEIPRLRQSALVHSPRAGQRS
jgi:hypothetical protein